MESGKGHQEEEEEKIATASKNNIKDGKNSEKANTVRSKHSVTEQRRRSKINERIQILRKLIPHSDQKRDTASFLLEVIEYVQFLKEKVHKYEGSYESCSSEPTKLIPWRNSHWNIQSIESDAIKDASFQSIDPAIEVQNKPMSIPTPPQTSFPVSMTNDGAFSNSLPSQASDAQSTECPTANDCLNGHDELTIEGGTISISSVYSHMLLNSLTQALQSTGVELSQASISVQLNLGKRVNRGPTQETSTATDHNTPMPSGNQPVRLFQVPTNTENLDQSQKRLKILQNG